MARVELSEVHKYYGDVHVVKGVSLTVEPGEFLVLLGPSGCGKSTCLRMIAGLETVSAGDVRIGERTVNDVEPKDRDIGMVFQSYALYPHMTVRENLAFGLKLRKESSENIEAQIEEAASILELSELLSRKPAQLSGGQRQRVAIGRAIVKKPSVFLFDEPLSNLDAALRVQMRTELARLHQQLPITTVYVTHDQVEAMMLADRIAILSAGVVQQIGRPMEIYRRPRNRFVAGFIGSPGMNFLPVQSLGDGVIGCVDCRVDAPGLEAHANIDGFELGIRPEDVEVGSGSISATVSLVESLGWDAYLHLEVDGHTVVARVDGNRGDRVSRGDSVQIGMRAAGVHIFDERGESHWCGGE